MLLATLVMWPSAAIAQSEDIPLGDLARTLRKNQAPPQTVIDNDNLSAVMDQGETRRWANGTTPVTSNRLTTQLLKVSSPDVTCALSFSGKDDAVEDNFKQQNLPEAEVSKLDGPAIIVGDSLQLSIHNGSGWNLREITVGVTLVHRETDVANQIEGLKLLPASIRNSELGEKHSDVTMLYHLKGSAAPLATTLFQAPLNLTISPDQEWHWAIVQAKGVPPAPTVDRTTDASTIQAPN